MFDANKKTAAMLFEVLEERKAHLEEWNRHNAGVDSIVEDLYKRGYRFENAEKILEWCELTTQEFCAICEKLQKLDDYLWSVLAQVYWEKQAYSAAIKLYQAMKQNGGKQHDRTG